MEQEDPSQNPFYSSDSDVPSMLPPSTPRTALSSIINYSRNLINMSARPFSISNPVTLKPEINTLSVESAEQTFHPVFETMASEVISETVEEVAAPVQEITQVRCEYCTDIYPSNMIETHTVDCDFRKIFCERCGDKVFMELYELHLEECNSPDESEEQSDMQQERRDNDEDDEDDSEREETSMEEEAPRPMRMGRHYYIPENQMTYERLLLLDNNAVKKGMTNEQLKKFLVKLYVKSLDGEGKCSICIAEYETGEYLRKLSCSHEYHERCIDQWLGENFTCPTCKRHLR